MSLSHHSLIISCDEHPQLNRDNVLLPASRRSWVDFGSPLMPTSVSGWSGGGGTLMSLRRNAYKYNACSYIKLVKPNI